MLLMSVACTVYYNYNSLKTVYFKDASDLRCSIFNRHHHVEDKIISTHNIGAFYKHVDRKLSCKSGVGPIKNLMVHYA